MNTPEKLASHFTGQADFTDWFTDSENGNELHKVSDFNEVFQKLNSGRFITGLSSKRIINWQTQRHRVAYQTMTISMKIWNFSYNQGIKDGTIFN